MVFFTYERVGWWFPTTVFSIFYDPAHPLFSVHTLSCPFPPLDSKLSSVLSTCTIHLKRHTLLHPVTIIFPQHISNYLNLFFLSYQTPVQSPFFLLVFSLITINRSYTPIKKYPAENISRPKSNINAKEA